MGASRKPLKVNVNIVSFEMDIESRPKSDVRRSARLGTWSHPVPSLHGGPIAPIESHDLRPHLDADDTLFLLARTNSKVDQSRVIVC